MAVRHWVWAMLLVVGVSPVRAADPPGPVAVPWATSASLARDGRALVFGLQPVLPEGAKAETELGMSGSDVPALPGPRAATVPPPRASGPALDTSAVEAQKVYNEALVQLAAGQRGRAEDLLQLALTTSPTFVKARFALGSLLDADGRTNDAIRQFEQGLATEPEHPRMETNYGIALMRAGRLDDSDAALQRAASLDPRSPYVFNAQGLLREKQQRYVEARASFEQALTMQPSFTAAHVNLGLLALSQRQVADAESQFAAAGDTSSDALDGLGVLRWFEGRSSDAELLFSRAVSVDHGNLTAQYNLALYLTSAGRYGEALYHLTGFDSDPHLEAQALTLRGVIDRQQGHPDLAEDDLQKAVAQSPASVSAQALLGLVAFEANEVDLAQLHLQAARDLDPHDAVVHNDLALVWRRKGKLGNAIEELEQAVNLAPDVADIQYNLGYLYDVSNRGDLALPHLKRYLVLSPHAADEDYVKQRIAQLSKLTKKKAL